MRTLLLSLAATAAVVAVAAPAGANGWHERSDFTGGAMGVQTVGSGGFGNAVAPPAGPRDFGRRGGHRGRGSGDVVGYGWYQGQDFDGNRSFDPDKFNDWWHERTWRSYPRWTQNNQNCERQYWTGAGWRC